MATASGYALGLLSLSGFSFLLRSLDVERRLKRIFLRRIQAYLALESECTFKQDEKEFDANSLTSPVAKSEWWRMGGKSISKLNKLDPLNSSLVPTDRFRLLLLINLLTFLFSLAGLGSVLPFSPESNGSCRFAVALAVLTFQLIHPITGLKLFLQLSTLSAKFYVKLLESPSTITIPFPRVAMAEQIIVYIFILIRIGSCIATSAVDGGQITSNVCFITIQPAAGAVNLALDCAFVLYLGIRHIWILWVAKALGLRVAASGNVVFDDMIKVTCFGRWLIGHVLGRSAAEIVVLLLLILSGAQQWIQQTGLQEFWVPQILVLLILLQAVNVPLLLSAPSTPIPFPTNELVGGAGSDSKRKPTLTNFIPGYTRRPSRSTTQILNSQEKIASALTVSSSMQDTSRLADVIPPVPSLPPNFAVGRESQDSSFMAAMATPLVFHAGSIRSSRTPGGSLSSFTDSTRQLPVNSRPLPPLAVGSQEINKSGLNFGLPGSVKIKGGTGIGGILPLYRQNEDGNEFGNRRSMRDAVDRVMKVGRAVSGFRRTEPSRGISSGRETNYRGSVGQIVSSEEAIDAGSVQSIRPLPREPLQPTPSISQIIAGPFPHPAPVKDTNSSSEANSFIDGRRPSSSNEHGLMGLPFIIPPPSTLSPLDIGDTATASISETPRSTPSLASRPIPSMPTTPRLSVDTRRSATIAREKRLTVETNLKMPGDSKRQKVEAVDGEIEGRVESFRW